ncbi:MAG: general secretion pathway protein GspK [Desulfobacterales bacterium]|nr:general secretion pathway protein GspK [Desulfobacteraceae bacterium]MDH3826855.1 general secretion pathway protein GspK [Desulfobacterales bacterium]
MNILNPKFKIRMFSMTKARTDIRNLQGEMPVSQKTVFRIHCSDEGMALISVLWILVLLTVIVGEFAYSMRTEVDITRNFKEATQANYIAQSGVIRSVVEMIRISDKTKNQEYPDEVESDRVWRINADIAPEKFGSGQFRVHIDNAAGLINLNTAGQKLLRLMVNTLDISDRQKDVIVDSILDWRDSDDFHRLHGAEKDYYQALPNPYACKNSAFDSLEELLLVRGMRSELFYKNLRPILTITPEIKSKHAAKGRSSGRAARTISSQININAAPRKLLEMLPQITSQQVQNLIDYRTDKDFISIEEIRYLIGEQTFSVISPYITLALSPYYTIRSEGRIADSKVRQIVRAMVKIDRELPGGYQIVSWQDHYF